MTSDVTPDTAHLAMLDRQDNLADKIRYACEQAVPPTTRQVRDWLTAHGVTASRQYTSTVVSAWRTAKGLGDTGDLVALTPELLAELDAVRSRSDTNDPQDNRPHDNGRQDNRRQDNRRQDNRRQDNRRQDRVTGQSEDTVGGVSGRHDRRGQARSSSVSSGGDVGDAVTGHPEVSPVTVASRQVTVTGQAPGTVASVSPVLSGQAPVVATPDTGGQDTSCVSDGGGRDRGVSDDSDGESVVLRWTATVAWVVVLAAALGISWWSLFDYARGFGIPTPLAAVVSLVFDASALIVAHLAHRYSTSPDSGAGPRLMLLALLGGSVYLNWQHAVSKGYGVEAGIMFAAPAAIGILLFELHTGWRSRGARRARGRMVDPLPPVGRWRWIFHPVQNLTTIWVVGRAEGAADRAARLERIHQRSW